LLTFLDVDHAMRGPDGLPRKDLFVEDQLHLSKEGYALWNKLLRPLLIPEPSNDR
jgi:lysophospholipase L1-like esterase